MSDSLKGRKMLVAGARGMVGHALMRRLDGEGCERLAPSRAELDLRDPTATRQWFAANRPDAVIVAAATVGGIHANATRPWDFLLDNLRIATSVLDAALASGVERLVYLGSSCIYPKHAAQPIAETALLSGPLEPTNAPYALAKISGLKLVEAARAQHGRRWVSAMPTNLYGPHDNFHSRDSHVIPGLLRRAHDRASAGKRDLPIWGTGTPRREFLHVDDCADALVRILRDYDDPAPINVGTGEDISIRELARLVMEVVGLQGDVLPDPDQPDGTPRKRLDVSKLAALGWRPRIGLREGLAQTYAWFQTHGNTARL